ncbi:hypothetical protein ACI2JR_17630 [Klebsiella sp. NPDC088457]
MRVFILLIMVLTAGGCGDKNQEARSYAESIINSYLKDPDTAKYKNVTVSRIKQSGSHPDMVHVCGLVNARNGFGAYTGNSKFVVSFLDSPSPELIHKEVATPNTITDDSSSSYWQTYCTVKNS